MAAVGRHGGIRPAWSAAVALIGLVLTGCSTQGPPTVAPKPPPHSPASSSAPASEAGDAVARSRFALAQYDYDKASAALQGVEGAEAARVREDIATARASAQVWPDNAKISHIFYHTLVVDPAQVFTKTDQGKDASQYMVSVNEFNAQLQQIYDRGYVLIHPQSVARPNEHGIMTDQQILLPPGKKPLILSQDDVNYYEYMAAGGYASKLLVDADGRVRNEYRDAAGKVSVGDYDMVPLLDRFIEQHPDFSYRGDKATLALTGYNGVLGYRSSVRKYGDKPATREAKAAAKRVADVLNRTGWKFASHSWGHINMTKTGLGGIKTDTESWAREVKPIVGATPLFILPFGADISGKGEYADSNEKFHYLHHAQGFDYFFNVDTSTLAWRQMRAKSLRQNRIDVDGIRMQMCLDGKGCPLNGFFDVRSTIDPLRPMPVPLPKA